ncbi:MAG: hypothetical protein CMP86_11980 [Gammaproteobacteria bacterium]|nr:hypothetical protein [Gammaproteobacteria bacterium]|tara:strand:- start:1050 stop:1439 length:390 start_codon:yes stop_codon:yes gene_type:complete
MSEEPRGFSRFLSQAGEVVGSPARLQKVAKQATAKMIQRGGASLASAQEQLRTLVDLVSAYVRGDYREVSATTLVSVVAALLYFIAPLDALPDFLFGWGLLDDAAVISYVSAQVRTELEAFKQWRDQGQ